jgi:hypothetical protein
MRTKLILIIGLFASVRFLSAQEVEGNGRSQSALFSPADYLQLAVPITTKVGINTYGFYLGNIQASIALLEAPITAQKHLVLTPSYLFVNVPPSGLTLLTDRTASQSYREHQFRMAASVSTVWHSYLISDRNMYVRRFTPTDDLNRYRNKIYLAKPLSAGQFKCSPFFFDEVYHDFAPGKWLRRNWVVAGADLPVASHLTFQPSYIRHNDSLLRSVNFLGLGVIIRVDPLLKHHTSDRASEEQSQPAFASGEADE